MELESLKYPIGKFQPPQEVSAGQREVFVDEIAKLPTQLREAIDGLTDEHLDTPYRPDGWTVRQVVHHVPDSHMNAYVRFRLALTEETPRIKPYREDRWAELVDGRAAPVEESTELLSALHVRWVRLLRSMSDEQWARTYDHPDSGPYPLWKALALYAWHGKHHVAHVTNLRQRNGWDMDEARRRPRLNG